jgi:hypothetical protein
MKYGSGMKRIAGASLMGALLLAVMLFISKPAAPQNGKAATKSSSSEKPTPRTPDGHPDLNGFWAGGGDSDEVFQRSADGSISYNIGTNFDKTKYCVDDSCQYSNQPSYKPEYMAKVKEIATTEAGGTTPLDPQFDCKPMGVPRANIAIGMGVGNFHIVQSAQAVAVLYESAPYSLYRIIYTDGRGHPDDLDTTYMGDSMGHWEGDTLVVDVTGLNDETWLAAPRDAPRAAGPVMSFMSYTNIHSDKEHVIERWTRKADTLTYEATVEDPVMFTRPWVVPPQHKHLARPGDHLLEGICVAYDKNNLVITDADKKNQCRSGNCGEDKSAPK